MNLFGKHLAPAIEAAFPRTTIGTALSKAIGLVLQFLRRMIEGLLNYS